MRKNENESPEVPKNKPWLQKTKHWKQKLIFDIDTVFFLLVRKNTLKKQRKEEEFWVIVWWYSLPGWQRQKKWGTFLFIYITIRKQTGIWWCSVFLLFYFFYSSDKPSPWVCTVYIYSECFSAKTDWKHGHRYSQMWVLS